MSRLSDNDRNLGPFTLGTWFKQFGIYFETGEESGRNRLMIVGFRRALRIMLPRIAKTSGLNYGFTLTNNDGNGYDHLTVRYGPNGSWDSSKDKRWSYFLPWKQWNHVRTSIYTPDGTHFFTDPNLFRWLRPFIEECPKAYFEFIDEADGTRVIASCLTEEREWHRGEKWCSWLKWFYPKKVHRSLWMEFNAEIGSEKGSWKGGIVGTGIEMEKDDTPQSAFLRFCEKGLDRRGRTTGLKYIGTCGPPPPKPKCEDTEAANTAVA